MAAVQFGQIVWADIADANGVRKGRPAVVVTPGDQIASATQLTVVAVTSRIPVPLPADHVPLPWHAQGHPRTGLNRKSAAVCSWIATIAVSDIQSLAGIVPGTVLLQILSRIAGPASTGTQTASPPDQAGDVEEENLTPNPPAQP